MPETATSWLSLTVRVDVAAPAEAAVVHLPRDAAVGGQANVVVVLRVVAREAAAVDALAAT